MTEPALQLSIIIPSFNEEARLPPTLERIYNFLSDRRDQLRNTEIIVVDDGSTDGTAKVAEDWMRKFPNLRLVSNGRNRGKGFSVRHGMLEARGRLTLFTDADLSTPIEEMDKLLDALRTQDVAIGSRALDRSMIETHQAWPRELAGIIFNTFVRILTGLPYLGYPVRLQSISPRARHNLFRAAAQRTIRLRSGAAVSGQAARAYLRRGTGALGPRSTDQSSRRHR